MGVMTVPDVRSGQDRVLTVEDMENMPDDEFRHELDDNEEPARHVIRQSGIAIFCHALDLSQPPDALLAQVRSLAQAIASAYLLQVAPGRP